MRLPKKVVVLTVTVAVLVALGVAGYLLVSGIGHFGAIEREFQGSKDTLGRYYRQDPFPSQGNVSRERRNVDLLKEWFDRTASAMAEGQVGSEEKSPSLFTGFLGEERARLEREAGDAVPEDFAFGFARYFEKGGELPAPDDVPRLTEQLQIVGNLCAVMFDAGVKSLSSVVREEFEGGPVSVGRSQVRPGRPTRTRMGDLKNPDAGLIPEGESYGKYHFVIEFAALEENIWKVLNGFAKNRMFIVPTGVWLKKSGVDVKVVEHVERAPGAGRPGEGGAAGDEGLPKYRRQRLVSGPRLETPLGVRIELDVYVFRKD